MKKLITTATDFIRFKEETLKWIEKYNLGSWEVYFRHRDIPDGTLALVDYDMEARFAVFHFGKDWDTHAGGKSVAEIRKTAREEVRHLLLARFHLMALDRTLTEDALMEEEHAIINALEHAR